MAIFVAPNLDLGFYYETVRPKSIKMLGYLKIVLNCSNYKYIKNFWSKSNYKIVIAVLPTAVCIGGQLLDFSLPELVRSQSTFSTDPEVLQNCASFTLCSSAGPAVGECSAVMGLKPCMLYVQIYCVYCIIVLFNVLLLLFVLDYYLLNSQLWIQDWVSLCFGNLCLLNTPQGSGYHKLYQLT